MKDPRGCDTENLPTCLSRLWLVVLLVPKLPEVSNHFMNHICGWNPAGHLLERHPDQTSKAQLGVMVILGSVAPSE